MIPRRCYDRPRLWATDPDDPSRPFDSTRNIAAFPYAEAFAWTQCTEYARCSDFTRSRGGWGSPCAVGERLLVRWGSMVASLVVGGDRGTEEVA